jgi:recombination endonuclease VII
MSPTGIPFKRETLFGDPACLECGVVMHNSRGDRRFCGHSCRRLFAKRKNTEKHLRSKARDPLRNRRNTVIRDYGLSWDEYQALLAAQGGVCKICNFPPTAKGLYVDHDHHTGAVRGLLCSRCNSGLGMFRDDASILMSAITYLAKKVIDVAS